jgi:polar amino acid transport system substrate-binding protein
MFYNLRRFYVVLLCQHRTIHRRFYALWVTNLVCIIHFLIPCYGQTMPVKIELAATDWCPYSCEQDPKEKGLVVDYLQYILQQHGHSLHVAFFPWTRAVQEVNNGNKFGLLTAVPAEAPNLLFTQQAVMTYQMCFYATQHTAWQYTGGDSLKKIVLGSISGYGYGEPVDSFVNDANNKNVVQLAGEHSLGRLITLVEKQRIDVFIADINVVQWQLRSRTSRPVKEVGCLPTNPFYVAVSPKLAWAPAFIALLDDALLKTANIEWLQQHKLRHFQ